MAWGIKNLRGKSPKVSYAEWFGGLLSMSPLHMVSEKLKNSWRGQNREKHSEECEKKMSNLG